MFLRKYRQASYKSGVIRKNISTKVKDMTISDYSETSTTAGVTSSSVTLKFNKTLMDTFSDSKQENVARSRIRSSS